MEDNDDMLQTAERLAGLVSASSDSFARLLDAQAAQRKVGAYQLHVLVQDARLGAANSAEAASDNSAFEAAFRYAADENCLDPLATQLLLAGMLVAATPGGSDESKIAATSVVAEE